MSPKKRFQYFLATSPWLFGMDKYDRRIARAKRKIMIDLVKIAKGLAEAINHTVKSQHDNRD